MFEIFHVYHGFEYFSILVWLNCMDYWYSFCQKEIIYLFALNACNQTSQTGNLFTEKRHLIKITWPWDQFKTAICFLFKIKYIFY